MTSRYGLIDVALHFFDVCEKGYIASSASSSNHSSQTGNI